MALPTLAPHEPSESESSPSGRPQPKREHIALAAVAVVVLLAGGWFFFLRSSGTSTPTTPVLHKPVVRVTGAAGATAAAAAAGTSAAANTAPGTQSELAAYVTKANAICATVNAKDNALDKSDSSIKGQIAVLDQQLPVYNSALRQLRALAVPAGHPEFAAMWKAQGQINSLAHQVRGALNDGSPNTVVQLTAWALSDAKTLNTQYATAGLTSCVSAA
jgi:hypothetical protein